MTPAAPLTDDAGLVARSLSGNREAFGQIISRYQALVCSVAYSATGRLDQSEDLAQETFLAAWRQLRDLREPGRLRAWLCGIARNLVHNSLRREKSDPARAGDPLETAHQLASPAPLPVEQAISRQEEAILWRSLEQIPESYREPLVLFYREHKSVEQVAASLELPEDLVRQRLSRGRKLLHEQVAAFVEGALERSRPGAAFTSSVLAALPMAGGSASAAGAGLGAIKGSALGSPAGLLAIFNLLFGPGVGLLGSYLSVRAALDGTRTARERDEVLRQVRAVVPGVVIFVAGLVLAGIFGEAWEAWPLALGLGGIALSCFYAGWLARLTLRSIARMRQLRAKERSLFPEAFPDGADRYELRSRITLLGLPLWHIRFEPPAVDVGPAIGWIAIGDRAIGVLFALGQVATALVSVGTLSVGVIAVGGISAGLISMGGVAIGLLVVGGTAFGLYAAGGLAFGWSGAAGGIACARDWAVGGHAFAAHANDAAARDRFTGLHADQVLFALLLLIFSLSIIPTAWLAWRARRQRNRNLP